MSFGDGNGLTPEDPSHIQFALDEGVSHGVGIKPIPHHLSRVIGISLALNEEKGILLHLRNR